MATCSRRDRTEEYLNGTAELTDAVDGLAARIAILQAEVWLEVAELEAAFDELDRVERALHDLVLVLEAAADVPEPL